MAFYSFCKADGIEGESKDSKHTNWIEVIEFNHGVRMKGGSVGATGMTGGVAEIDEFEIVKLMDKSSPLLHRYCVSGKVIPKIEFHVCAANAEQHTYLKYTLTNAIVSEIKPSGVSKGDGDRPTERVEFRFAKIKWEYVPWTDDGAEGSAVQTEWDVAGNKGS